MWGPQGAEETPPHSMVPYQRCMCQERLSFPWCLRLLQGKSLLKARVRG